MSDLNKTLEETGAKNEAELLKVFREQKAEIESLKSKVEEQNATLTSADLELEKVKRERTTAKSQATKAEKKLEESQAEKGSLEKALEAAVEKEESLQNELSNLSTEVNELKEKLAQGRKNLPSLDKLRAKAKVILKQEKANKVFMSLTGQAFLNENKCKNAFGSKYKIAVLVDEDKVHLSSPS